MIFFTWNKRQKRWIRLYNPRDDQIEQRLALVRIKFYFSDNIFCIPTV